MHGKKEFKPKVLYQFSLEKAVPPNHLLRRLQSILELEFIYNKTKDLYGYNGNKSVDPVVVVKILLLGFLYNIPSIRELMRQIEDRLSFRWFLGYDIDEKIPDHSAISKNLSRFGPDLFEELFNRIVEQCIRAGLVGGKLVHMDSSLIKADASEDSVKPKPPKDGFHPDIAPKEYWERVKAEAKQEGKNVNDYLESSTDPEAKIHSHNGKGRQLAYKDHRAVDDKRGVILATQATGADVPDEAQFKSLLNELLWKQGVNPESVAADKKYGDVDVYVELLDKGITPYIGRKRAAHPKGIYGKELFTYLPEEDRYICPAGHPLLPQSKTNTKRRLFRASTPVCRACPLKKQCTKGKGPRTIYRHTDEYYVEQALADKDTAPFKEALKRRFSVAEGSFADAKDNRSHRRARWRGLVKMQIQCHLVAAAQNLKKLLAYGWKYAGTGAEQLNNTTDFLFFALQRTGFNPIFALLGFFRVRLARW